jgi:type I restriction enzyme S subunit
MAYIEAFLSSSDFVRQIDLLKTGSTIQHFGSMHLSQVKVPLPPLDQQRTVASELEIVNEQTRSIRKLIERQVSLLMQRRQALITAAVTGQIDVSTASGRGVTDGMA